MIGSRFGSGIRAMGESDSNSERRFHPRQQSLVSRSLDLSLLHGHTRFEFGYAGDVGYAAEGIFASGPREHAFEFAAAFPSLPDASGQYREVGPDWANARANLCLSSRYHP